MANLIHVLVCGRQSPALDLPGTVTADDAGSLYIADNDGNVVVHAINPTDEAGSVTLVPQGGFADITFEAPVVVIEANSEGWLGPFPPAVFNDDLQRVFLAENPPGFGEYNGLRF